MRSPGHGKSYAAYNDVVSRHRGAGERNHPSSRNPFGVPDAIPQTCRHPSRHPRREEAHPSLRESLVDPITFIGSLSSLPPRGEISDLGIPLLYDVPHSVFCRRGFFLDNTPAYRIGYDSITIDVAQSRKRHRVGRRYHFLAGRVLILRAVPDRRACSSPPLEPAVFSSIQRS